MVEITASRTSALQASLNIAKSVGTVESSGKAPWVIGGGAAVVRGVLAAWVLVVAVVGLDPVASEL